MKWKSEIDEILARTRFGEVPRPTGQQTLWAVLFGAVIAVAVMVLIRDEERRAAATQLRRRVSVF